MSREGCWSCTGASCRCRDANRGRPGPFTRTVRAQQPRSNQSPRSRDVTASWTRPTTPDDVAAEPRRAFVTRIPPGGSIDTTAPTTRDATTAPTTARLVPYAPVLYPHVVGVVVSGGRAASRTSLEPALSSRSRGRMPCPGPC